MATEEKVVTIEDCTDSAQKLQKLLVDKKQDEAEEKDHKNVLLAGYRQGLIDADWADVMGVPMTTKSNGYDDAIVALLKEKGLREAVSVKETYDGPTVKEYLANGTLTEAEVAIYKKADTVYFSLPRAKKEK